MPSHPIYHFPSAQAPCIITDSKLHCCCWEGLRERQSEPSKYDVHTEGKRITRGRGLVQILQCNQYQERGRSIESNIVPMSFVDGRRGEMRDAPAGARMSESSREWFLVQLPLFCPSLSVGVSCLSSPPPSSLYLHQPTMWSIVI